MSTLTKVLLTILLMVIAFVVGLLNTHVIISISTLFSVTFITQYSFLQIYGALIIVSLLNFKMVKNDDDYDEQLKKMWDSVFTRTIYVLSIWGLSFIAYYIIS